MADEVPSYIRKLVVQVDEIHREMGRGAPGTRTSIASKWLRT